MNKRIPIVISLVLSAFLLLSVIGCGGGNKKSEQAPAKTATTQETKKEAPKEEKTSFIVGTDVNAREKASTDSAIVGTFALGEKVIILADEPEWAKVKRSDGKDCYVFKKFLGTQEDLDKRQAKYAGFAVLNNGHIDAMMQRDKVTRTDRVYKGMRHSPSFVQDGITDLRYTAIVDSDTLPQKVSFSSGGKELWSTRLPMNEVYASNSTMQIKDQYSGKILYTLGSGSQAYILSYNSNDKKALVHFDSTDLNGPYKNDSNNHEIEFKDLEIKDGQLYLTIYPFASYPRKSRVAYHLFWDNVAAGIGYEYIGNF